MDVHEKFKVKNGGILESELIAETSIKEIQTNTTNITSVFIEDIDVKQ